jgi:thiamine-monophosphate kinase
MAAINPKIEQLGERGFLRELLPRLQQIKSRRFLIPPGDDAAVLSPHRTVLSIDGLTEGTHFRLSWAPQVKKWGGFSLGRALGWKLMGSSLSDLAAMGDVRNRWAMIYAGIPASTRLSFLWEFYKVIKEASERFDCLVVGGDTVNARELTLVAAVGGTLTSERALCRSGASPGDSIGVAGVVGDSGVGLSFLERKNSRLRSQDKKYFLTKFFKHQPLFKIGLQLARDPGVTSALDLSDSLQESIEILSKASTVGADIWLEDIPTSLPFKRLWKPPAQILSQGEDYGLLFTARTEAMRRLQRKSKVAVIGQVADPKRGIRYFMQGREIRPGTYYQQFS